MAKAVELFSPVGKTIAIAASAGPTTVTPTSPGADYGAALRVCNVGAKTVYVAMGVSGMSTLTSTIPSVASANAGVPVVAGGVAWFDMPGSVTQVQTRCAATESTTVFLTTCHTG